MPVIILMPFVGRTSQRLAAARFDVLAIRQQHSDHLYVPVQRRHTQRLYSAAAPRHPPCPLKKPCAALGRLARGCLRHCPVAASQPPDVSLQPP